jgi:hypothetical protein
MESVYDSSGAEQQIRVAGYPLHFVALVRACIHLYSEEVTMNWNNWVRQIHRWLSIAFTVAILVNFIAVAQKSYTVWVGLLALVPMALLLISGLYLFILPYATKWRSRRSPRAAETPPIVSG